ncbi:MAG TPA: M14 family zinc carboxypeptidase, partial [Actinomycetes bacterium]|nr:M14 family zinc carboxypeptidase [Actinomycetes bacterium]
MRHARRSVVVLAAAALLGTGALVSAPAAAAAPFPPSDVELEVYEGTVDAAGVEELRSLGLDAQDFVTEPAPDGGADVEVVLSPDQAAKLADAGVDLEVKQVDGVAASEALALQASAGWDAFRPYSSIGGGIKDELYAAAGQYDDITEIVNVGQSVLGEDILALRVTRNADRVRDGRRPAVMYMGTQHAREWITTEMVRRLMHHVLDSYGTDEQITNLVDTRELWFLPVQNVDGYDFTFTEGNRLWRKNLRDNDGDGEITFRDGVDLNRNFATNWGYDNEGS